MPQRRASPVIQINLGFNDLPKFVIRASLLALTQTGIIFAVLFAALNVFIYMGRQMLTWYRFPKRETQLLKVMYAVISLFTMLLGFTVLPVLSHLLLYPSEPFGQTTLMGALFCFGLTVMGLGIYVHLNRRYAQRCPNCEEKAGDKLPFTGYCSQCKALLNPWLIVEY